MDIRKLVVGLALTTIMACPVSFAQAKKPTPKPPVKSHVTKKKPAASVLKHMKKDGTPDRRFKENKTASGPLKKDGTPDMRFKANKHHKATAPKKKPAPKTGH